MFVAWGQQKTAESTLLEEIEGDGVEKVDYSTVLVGTLVSVALFISVAVSGGAIVPLTPAGDEGPNMRLDYPGRSANNGREAFRAELVHAMGKR